MSDSANWGDRIRTLPQYLIPQHLLSSCMHAITRIRWSPIKNLLIGSFIRLYKVDMSIAVEPKYRNYTSFNDFFTRALAPAARPIDQASDSVVCPVDGYVSQTGPVTAGLLLQAKGYHYSILELLAGDAGLAGLFENGSFATLYLSPRDYHRIHMPVAGMLKQTIYVPGSLFSVNNSTARSVPRLFARNERTISIFETDNGYLAMILVGAIFVGSMQTIVEGQITPPYTAEIKRFDYTGQESSTPLDKGQEFGRFNMGSTVILLFQKGHIEWLAELEPGSEITMGQAIGKLQVTYNMKNL